MQVNVSFLLTLYSVDDIRTNSTILLMCIFVHDW